MGGVGSARPARCHRSARWAPFPFACLLCSVDSFCSFSMHVRVWSSPLGGFYSLLLCSTTTRSLRGQHMLKPPRIGDDRARPYLAQTMLNFLHLGKSRFLLMIVLSLTHHRGPVHPKYPNPPSKPNRNSSSPLHVPTD